MEYKQNVGVCDILDAQGDADRYAKVWKVFGKPNPEPYNLAATVLSKQAKALGWKVPDEVKPPYNIFMIGGDRTAWDYFSSSLNPIKFTCFQDFPGGFDL